MRLSVLREHGPGRKVLRYAEGGIVIVIVSLLVWVSVLYYVFLKVYEFGGLALREGDRHVVKSAMSRAGQTPQSVSS